MGWSRKSHFDSLIPSEHLYEPVEKRIVHDEKRAAPPPSPPSPRIAEEVVHREIQKARPLASAKAKEEGAERREKTPPKANLKSPTPPPPPTEAKAKVKSRGADADAGAKSIPPPPTTPAEEPVFLTQPEEPPSRTTTAMASRSGGR